MTVLKITYNSITVANLSEHLKPGWCVIGHYGHNGWRVIGKFQTEEQARSLADALEADGEEN